MKAVLLGSRNGGLERVEALNARARSAGLVEFVLVDATQEPHHIVQECEGAKVLIGPDREETVKLAQDIAGLKLIQTFSAGTNSLDKGLLLNIGVQVANNGGANAVCVAEHAIWLMTTINHKFDKQIASVRAGHWASDVTGAREEFRTLVDRRVGIVGLGRIGSRVAKRLTGWECDVVFHDAVEFDADYVREAGAHRVSLDELIETSDIVSLHVPLDRSTNGMISTEQFRAMKKTAILINTCRGPVVDESAMIHALKTSEIFAAGMDVTEVEPIQPDNELLTLPNVVITPHLGAITIESEWNATLNAVENAERIARGDNPLWVVDPV